MDTKEQDIELPDDDIWTLTIDGKDIEVHPQVGALLLAVSQERDLLRFQLDRYLLKTGKVLH